MAGELSHKQEPDIDASIWNGSKIEIHNVDGILAEADAGPTILFSEADFDSPIAQAEFGIKATEENGVPAYTMGATIQLDASEHDMPAMLAKLRGDLHIRANARKGNLHYTNTVFANVFAIGDAASGLNTLIHIGNNGSVSIFNSGELKNEEKGLQVSVAPPSKDSMDYRAALKGFSQIFVETLDLCNGTVHRRPFMERTYVLGDDESFRQASASSAQALGSTTVQSASADEDSPSDELDKLSLQIEFLDQDTRLEDIGGLETAKERLRQVALAFTHQDDRRRGNPTRPQGVLLYGEPGTGKKILIEALANEIGAALWPIQSSDIYQGPNATPEANMNAIFNGARQLQERTVLLFHDFEALFGNTDSQDPEAADKTNHALADLFKQQVEALVQANPNILIALTTNQPGNIDSSLIDPSRFAVAIPIPMPDEAARAQIFTNLIARSMAHSTPFGNDLSVDELAYETDGMSGADINNVLRQAFTRAQHESESGTETPISQDDIVAAIQTFKTS